MVEVALPAEKQVKVLEFKASLSTNQRSLLAEMQEHLLGAWNRGLALLEWRQHYDRLKKCLEVELANDWGFDLKPVKIDMKKNELELFAGRDRKRKLKPFKKETVWAACCQIAADFRVDRSKSKDIEGNQELRGVVNLVKPHWQQLPPFGAGTEVKAVWGAFARKRWDKWPEHLSQSYLNDYLALVLDQSWAMYRKGVLSRPRYKSSKRGDRVKTIGLRRSADNIKIDRERSGVSVPTFGLIRVKGLCDRLPSNVSICKVAIAEKASGVYLQLTVELAKPKLFKPRQTATGLDLGLQFLYCTAQGREVSPQRTYRAVESKIQRLQRRLSARKGRKFPPKVGSKRYQAAQRRIARLQEKAANQRRLFNHAHSTHLVSAFGAIAVEELAWNQMNRKPKPKLAEDGKTFIANRRQQKAGLNKSFADAAIGQFRTFLATKAKLHEREFVQVPAAYTSQTCPQCGSIHKKSLSTRTHQCSACGYETGRDVAAAQVILQRAEFVGNYLEPQYRSALRESTGAECEVSSTVKRQPEAVTLGTVDVSKMQAPADMEGHTPSATFRSMKSCTSKVRRRRLPADGVQLALGF